MAVKRQVIACVDAGLADYEMMAARSLAGQIFAEIGVTIEWRLTLRGCPTGGIAIRLSDRIPPMARSSALGMSQPYEGRQITLFYRRIRRYRAYMLTAVMGHVLAHEIAHNLQGIDRHSESGLMKAHWQNADFARMSVNPLRFTKEDIELIHDGLDRRPLALQ